MSNIIRQPKGLALPSGVAEKREQERIEKMIPLAIESEEKAKADFQAFLEEHNVFFEVHLDYRETQQGKRAIGQGLTFISKLRLPEEEQLIQ
jgi:hypothetical protein